jgi:hypothetical protein
MQGTDITLNSDTISPLYSTISGNFNFNYKLAISGLGSGYWRISVVAMKISNTTTGGVTGGGNYGRFRQR